MAGNLLELRQISKYYGGVLALDSIQIEVGSGEIVAIVGDNGAGKSSLIRTISGTQAFDSGEIIFESKKVAISRPTDATALGIQTVYQDLALCDNLDTVQNLFLGSEMTSFRRLERSAMERRAATLLDSLGVKIRSITTPVGRLSGGQRQSIAVARSILRDPKLVLLDEPTAALGVEQSAQVLNLVRRLRDEGRSVIMVSHNMRDVLDVAERVIVLRLGQKVAEFDREGLDVDKLIAAITGAVDLRSPAEESDR